MDPDRKPKRGYKKSRNGCRTCKKRRIKCNEQRPLCSNCAIRSPEIKACDFEPLKLWGRLAIQNKQHALTINSKIPAAEAALEQVNRDSLPNREPHSWLQVLTCLPSHISASNNRRRLELRLINHFQKFVPGYMHNNGQMKGRVAFWEHYVPQLAFQADGALHGVLALSALHLRHLCPNDRSLDHAAGYYISSAAATLRKLINNVNRANARDAMATSIIIAFYTWIVSSAVSTSGPYVLPVHFFYILYGSTPLAPLVEPYEPDLQRLWELRWPSILDIYDSNHESKLFSSAKQDLAQLLAAIPKDASKETKEVYQKAAAYVAGLISAVSSGVPSVQIQKGLPMPGRVFGLVPLLEAHEPIALALFARNLCLSKFLDHAWWVHGWSSQDRVSEYHVRGIAGLMPRDWLWAMDWPIRIVTGLLKPDSRVVEVVDDVDLIARGIENPLATEKS